MEKIEKQLIELAESKYKEFHSSLMPTVDKDTVLGIRVPILRSYAKKIFKENNFEIFLEELPHKYFEENNLHAFLIEQIKDFDEVIEKTEKFLPYIDNWATCDMFTPKVYKKEKERLFPFIEKWIKQEEVYTRRYGIKLLMSLFLDESFSESHLDLVKNACSDEYYVNMVVAWYFATALAKQEKSTLFYFENAILPVWVHNKAIQKAVESRRISPELKEYVKGLKIK